MDKNNQVNGTYPPSVALKDYQVTMMDISQIKTSNDYLRTDTDVSGLVRSIQSIGLINPLSINSKNELIAGGRRYSALIELGVKVAPVIILDHDELREELISIDENLMRKRLTPLEVESSLRRAKTIYDELYPENDMPKPDDQNEDEVEVEVLPTSKFLQETSAKTGLSIKAIESAIERDQKSSKQVKDARRNNQISATQTNEIIKLKKGEQDQILDAIHQRPLKEVREFVKDIRNSGLETALQEYHQTEREPAEIIKLRAQAKRFTRYLGQFVADDYVFDTPNEHELIEDLSKLKKKINEVMTAYRP